MKCLLVWSVLKILVEKIIISSSIWPKSFIQTVKYSFFSQRIVYQSFYGASFVFNYFLIQGKVLCFSPCRQVAYEMFISSEDPCRKNHISSFIWHKSFIQTVKCSFFSQRMFIKVSLARKSFVFRHASASRFTKCLFMWSGLRILVEKMISLVLFDPNCSFKR